MAALGGNQPQVAICMTAYNSASFIGIQIESILQQTYKNWHLYISDDCSQDNTISVIETYAKTSRNITYIKNDVNVGVGKNFERALAMIGDEELVAICDSDDYCMPQKLEVQVKLMTEHDYVLVHHDAQLVDENLNDLHQSLWDKLRGGQIAERYITSPVVVSLLERNSVSGATTMYRTVVNKYIVPFPVHMVQDYWVALVCATKGRIGASNEPLIKYRQHASSLQGAVVRSPSYYLRRIGSRRFHDEYKVEAADNISAMLRLMDISVQQADKDAVMQRYLIYEQVVKVLASKFPMTLFTGVAAIRLAVHVTSGYYRMILIFFTISKTLEIRS
jgi:glycosyltransferase involved in cell wall biosynthesis